MIEYFLSGLAVSGLLQWVKSFDAKKQVHASVYAVLLLALALVYFYIPEQIQKGLIVLSIAQLGYELLVQPIKKALRDKINIE